MTNNYLHLATYDLATLTLGLSLATNYYILNVFYTCYHDHLSYASQLMLH